MKKQFLSQPPFQEQGHGPPNHGNSPKAVYMHAIHKMTLLRSTLPPEKHLVMFYAPDKKTL